MYCHMSDKRKTRIKLLEDMRDIVGESYQTDRDMYSYNVRKKNRKLKKMLKEIEEWTEDLEVDGRVDHCLEIQKRKEANAKQHIDNH